MLLPSTSALDNSAKYWIPSVCPPLCEFESRFSTLSLPSPPTNRLCLSSETCFSLPAHFSIFTCQFPPIHFHLHTMDFSVPTFFWPFHPHATVSASLYAPSGNVLDEHFQTPCPPAPAKGFRVWWKGHESARSCLWIPPFVDARIQHRHSNASLQGWIM